MKIKEVFPKIMDHLSKIGKIDEVGISHDHKTGVETFKYRFKGKRKVSDFRSFEIMRDIQENFLYEYSIIDKMEMDDEILEVYLKKEVNNSN